MPRECTHRTAPRHLGQRRTRQTSPQRTWFSLPVSRWPLPSTSKALKAASIQLSHSEDSCAATFSAGLQQLLPYGLSGYLQQDALQQTCITYIIEMLCCNVTTLASTRQPDKSGMDTHRRKHSRKCARAYLK